MGERSRWKFWLWMGLTSFGGPGAQIATLRAEVVERRGWLTAEQFGRALGLCFFLPGPEAQQMIAWTAWKLDGWRSALMATVAFILPGLLACAALGYVYVLYGQLPAVEGALVGVRAVVGGILFVSAWRIGAGAYKGAWHGLTSLGAFLGLTFGLPFGIYALIAGGAGWGFARPEEAEPEAPSSPGIIRRLVLGLLPFLIIGGVIVAWSGWTSGFGRLAGVSAFAVLTSFGGAYAALSLWRTQADAAGWLPSARFGDALVVGEATPGPLMLAGSFIGFVAGYQGVLGGGSGWGPALLGWIIPAVFTFGLSTALILATAPLGEAGVASFRFRAAMGFVTAAAAGALAWMGAMLAWSAGFHVLPVALTLGSAALAWRGGLGVPWLLALGAFIGWAAG
jgi:chromate transporter